MTCLEEVNPVDKNCGMCRKRLLLSEFDYSQSAKDRRALFCVTCENEKRETDSDFCCSGGDILIFA